MPKATQLVNMTVRFSVGDSSTGSEVNEYEKTHLLARSFCVDSRLLSNGKAQSLAKSYVVQESAKAITTMSTSKKLTADEASHNKASEDVTFDKGTIGKLPEAQEEKSLAKDLTCPSCKQTRIACAVAPSDAANEHMWTFCECTVCGRRWKFESLPGEPEKRIDDAMKEENPSK